MQGKVIYPDGTVQPITLPEEAEERLRALQETVGGYIEVLALPKRHSMVIHEEAKFRAHECNDLATSIAFQAGTIGPFDYIANVAVVVPTEARE